MRNSHFALGFRIFQSLWIWPLHPSALVRAAVNRRSNACAGYNHVLSYFQMRLSASSFGIVALIHLPSRKKPMVIHLKKSKKRARWDLNPRPTAFSGDYRRLGAAKALPRYPYFALLSTARKQSALRAHVQPSQLIRIYRLRFDLKNADGLYLQIAPETQGHESSCDVCVVDSGSGSSIWPSQRGTRKGCTQRCKKPWLRSGVSVSDTLSI